MLELSKEIRAYLEALHPVLPWAVLTLLVFVTVWASRKVAPRLWLWFDEVTPDGMVSHVIQGLPAVLVGALASELLTGGDLAAAWKGALAGALAPVTHLLLKASPVPYQGAIRAVANKAGLGTLVAVVLLLSGCQGSFEEARTAHAAAALKFGATPRPTEYCQGLDAAKTNFGVAGTAFAGASALAAGSVVYWKTSDGDRNAALTAGGLTIVSGAAFGLGQGYSTRWARDCAQ
jgi:hypothetical protein